MRTVASRTPLYDRHLSLGAKMFEFAKWEMPLWYSSITDEHVAVRHGVGIFDVSHMGKILISGSTASDNLDWIMTREVSRSRPGKGVYSHLLKENGNIIDDLIVTRLSDDKFFVVCNAAKIDEILEWFLRKGERIQFNNFTEDYGCVAVQGPSAIDTIGKLLPVEGIDLRRFSAQYSRLEIAGQEEDYIDWATNLGDPGKKGVPALISRTGYTGEDGFEIFAKSRHLPHIWDELLKVGEEYSIHPCGLGARDTLRLEMCYLLSDHDFNGGQNPIETDTEFVIDWDHEFIGKDALVKRKENMSSRLTAFTSISRGIPREGYPLCREDGQHLGKVTSGTMSPCLKIGIGMGYLPMDLSEPCNKIFYGIGSRRVEAHVVDKPFMKR